MQPVIAGGYDRVRWFDDRAFEHGIDLDFLEMGTLVTRRRTGLWEDNQPPSMNVQNEVFQAHYRMIGDPAPPPLEKRLFDLLLALVGIVIAAPVLILIAVVIWLEDPGPVFFVKNSVGKGGGNFHQLKFRTMVYQAESKTGPILARQDDVRTLLVGHLLRQTALD